MNFTQKLSTALFAGVAAGSCLLASEPANAAQMFTLSETRNEDELFDGASRFLENTFTFDLPELASTSLDFSIEWNDLDTDWRYEAFDVTLTDQLGGTIQVFDKINANQGGDLYNSDGYYDTSIVLPSLTQGSISFDVFFDGYYNDINSYPPNGSMTLSVSGQEAESVPESSLMVGLLGVGLLGVGTTLKRKFS